jgi:murein DD-endopeptidase MepM/ murein hydrolase activator NlpD
VSRRRGVCILKTGQKLVVLACVVPLLHPSLASGAGRRRAGRHAQPTKRVRSAPVAPVVPVAQGSTEDHVHVRTGDTLGTLLAAHGVGASEARLWLASAVGVYDVRRLEPRRGVTFRFDRATHALQAIHYEIDDRTLLTLERTADGIRAARAPLPYFIEVKGAAGRIARGLREDATAAGVPPRIVSELAEIFGWELDVDSGLHPGDEFRVLYENSWQTGGAVPEPGNVLGAELIARGHPLVAVYFEDRDGRGAYYRPSGDPLSRDFLRYPVEFTEVTSEFSLLRDHPILHRSRPHLGVDLAAPTGTPVRAVASGAVSEAGWENELGRCVRVGHPGSITSLYGHLSRFAAGIREGVQVERGQIIGYVGTTGLATGPHLHFAMDRDGEYVDPLALTAAAGARIPDAARRAFERVQAVVTRQLAALPQSAEPRTVSLSSAGFRAR